MGTRGVLGFRKNAEDKLMYNHYDSYPDYLGYKVLEFIAGSTIEEMEDIFDRIILVDEDSKPTPEQIEECKKYANTEVSTGSLEDWYCLLREAQGGLEVYKNGLRYMINSNEFIKDSLFCEYGYIINLNTQCLEFYVGFQRRPEEYNRYGTEEDGGYYPCKCVLVVPLYVIKEGWKTPDELVELMKTAAENDYKEQEE